MRFMSLVKVSEDIAPPDPALFAAIEEFREEMVKAGILVDNGGLRPSAEGARLRLENGKVVVTDGPFAETKEVIGGFAIIQAESKEEAIEHTRRFLQIHADVLGPSFEAEIELRPMAGQPEPAHG